MLSLKEALIKRELPFVSDWYSLEAKTNNLWKDICIVKIAYAIYLYRNCSVIHALSKAYSIFLRGNLGAHCMSIIPRSFTRKQEVDNILLLQKQYDFLLRRLGGIPSQERFENFQENIWEEMDREDELVEDYRISGRTPDKNSSVAIMFGDEEYIRNYFLNKRVSLHRLI